MTPGERLPDAFAEREERGRHGGAPMAPEFLQAERIAHRLRRVLQRAGALFSETLGDNQLTPTQWSVLMALYQEGPLSQVRLGRVTFVDPATTQGVVMRLIERGFLERRTDPRDRRRKSVWLTSTGEALVASLLPKVSETHARVLEPLSPSDRERFLDLLERLS